MEQDTTYDWDGLARRLATAAAQAWRRPYPLPTIDLTEPEPAPKEAPASV